MKRAYSLATIITKGTDDARVIEGVATTPTPDRAGDIVVPEGARFKLPLPLLWQHDHAQPIGTVESASVGPDGIRFRARLAKASEDGTLKNRLDEAWQSIKLGLTRAVSIGFRPLEHSYLDEGGVRFHAWDWMELSVVTIPANSEATIANAKFYAKNAPATGAETWQERCMAPFFQSVDAGEGDIWKVVGGAVEGLLSVADALERRIVDLEALATTPDGQS